MAEKNKTAFRKALTDAALARYEKTLREDTAPVVFSDAYREEIARLTQKTERKTWRYVNAAWKRVLIAVILAFLLAATAVAAVPALREGLIRFFTHDDGVAFSFEFSQEDLDRAPKEIETRYAPTYVPEGCTLYISNFMARSNLIIYKDLSGEDIAFYQNVLWEYVERDDNGRYGLTINSEDVVSRETRLINGYEICMMLNRYPDGFEDYTLIWTDQSYFYSLFVPKLSDEEIVKIITGISPVEPE